ncbi:hypothetical protein [Nocardioides mesophilus]|uniref:Uncharacterized protein n=1 Tax=Nocardioides mesophilus TaxID=433659 RepID=A0A7G9RBF1_9ACTN|nr:hypothetical protein [Nocardioides mesophilus]QNN52926.1 hypothetical protein H9L09_21350 [Nocardioides mesophilus]
MLVEKDDVTDALRARGDHDRAVQAQVALPRHVDTVREASLLHQLDLNVEEIEAVAAAASTSSHRASA